MVTSARALDVISGRTQNNCTTLGLEIWSISAQSKLPGKMSKIQDPLTIREYHQETRLLASVKNFACLQISPCKFSGVPEMQYNNIQHKFTSPTDSHPQSSRYCTTVLGNIVLCEVTLLFFPRSPGPVGICS